MFTYGPQGELEMRSDVAVSSVSSPLPVCFTLTSLWGRHTIYSLSSCSVHLSQGEMSKVWRMRGRPNISLWWCPVSQPVQRMLPFFHFLCNYIACCCSFFRIDKRKMILNKYLFLLTFHIFSYFLMHCKKGNLFATGWLDRKIKEASRSFQDVLVWFLAWIFSLLSLLSYVSLLPCEIVS